MAICNADRRYRPNKNTCQRSYKIINEKTKTKLSRRELECIFYLLRGQTAANIAMLLKLSPKTVEYYIENIKNKMNCNSKSELIEKAINENFIDMIPESILLNANISLIL